MPKKETPPKAAEKKSAMSNAERQAAYRARKGKQVGVVLAPEAKTGLDEYLIRRHLRGKEPMSMSDVIEKLLRTQLLRKR